MPMIVNIHWTDVALRLLLTVLASLLLGFNRSQHGKAAGMSTTLLVGLAACVAMILVNFLLPTAGRQPDSFVMNDLMRLPLGILTGVGFIGAGAILRRREIVLGVTTAATLWLATVMGLTMGGGQILLGFSATALGLFVLWGVKRFERQFKSEHAVRLSMELEESGPSETEIRRRISDADVSIGRSGALLSATRRMIEFDLIELRRPDTTQIPDFVQKLAREGVF
ncbi:MgtC/SapB family protein [Methylocystis sp. IM3]|uniref:MgtC/SapB family protein n=1 Tax=unclassified Methylocystis TaxID=2625913 RepID=UPI0030FABEAC